MTYVDCFRGDVDEGKVLFACMLLWLEVGDAVFEKRAVPMARLEGMAFGASLGQAS